MPRKTTRRLRPKRLKTNPLEHAKFRRRWRSWLPQMLQDISDMLDKREIFRELQEVARENPTVLSPGDFFDWMRRNFITAITVGIRSFVDQSTNVHSLWRMLYEILERPRVINRRAHISLYRCIPRGFYFGNRTFDNVVGPNRQYLTQQMIKSDMKELEDASERVRRFVNKRVAHRTPASKMRRLPKLNEIDKALDSLDRIFCKYNLLLVASGMTSVHAERQCDWMEVLLEPWIPVGSKLHPDA